MTNRLLRLTVAISLLGAYGTMIVLFGPEVWSFFRATFGTIVSIFI